MVVVLIYVCSYKPRQLIKLDIIKWEKPRFRLILSTIITTTELSHHAWCTLNTVGEKCQVTTVSFGAAGITSFRCTRIVSVLFLQLYLGTFFRWINVEYHNSKVPQFFCEIKQGSTVSLFVTLRRIECFNWSSHEYQEKG